MEPKFTLLENHATQSSIFVIKHLKHHAMSIINIHNLLNNNDDELDVQMISFVKIARTLHFALEFVLCSSVSAHVFYL